MSRLEEQLARLTPEQRAALEAKLRERAVLRDRVTRIRPRARTAEPALSFAQQRLWFVEQLEPAGAAYHMSAAVRIVGDLSLPALERSFTEILRRHDVLRAGYADVQGRPVQRIGAEQPCRIDVLQAPDGPAAQRGGDTRRLVEQESARPFDLTSGPLLRASLIRVSEREHVLVLVVHHIAADGWSMGVLTRELGALYAAGGDAAALPPLPIQYADFAAWQRERLAGDRLKSELEWWRARLADLPVLELPTDHVRTGGQSAAGSREPLSLPADLVDALTRVSRAHDVTLFMTLLAAFQVFLARWTGQSDIAVGCPVAGRNWPEVEPLIGLFVNTLVCRTRLSGDPTAAEVLGRVRETVAGALAHQDVPFERVVEELHVERTLSRAPLTSVFFAFQNVPPATLSLAGLDVSEFPYERRTSRFDISLFASEGPDGLRCSMEYRTELFRPGTIRRMLDGYARVLEAIAASPRRSISSIPLLGERDRRRVVEDWNATTRTCARRPLVPDLVARQAARGRDATAIVSGGARITYGELESRSNRLARHLVRAGVGREAVVALYGDRGAAFVVAALAVMKAGAAYAPVDRRTPPRRLARILRKAGIGILLIESGLEVAVPDWTGTTIDLRTAAPAIDAEPDDPVRVGTDPDELAYVIHTSGSTGEPNGVAITHASLLNLVAWHQRTYAVDRETVATQVASVGFDACVWELWPYLTAGSAIHVPADEVRDDPPRLWQWLADEGVTIAFLPTPLAEAVLRLPVPGGLALTTLLTGGDRLHQAPGAAPPFALVNHYGPTESTVVATCARVDPGSGAAPPIGRPIDNTRAYVLDRWREPVPVGVWGELYVGGDGLARGYAGAAGLTAERFVPDSVSGARGARLYRTGDLVRFCEDGTLEFSGRRDRQVKIRGHRIELGEIERALSSHPAVASAVVGVHDGPSGAATLAAWFVPASGAAAREDALRSFLRERLPDYMVPTWLVPIERLPLTTNGKVDRTALPVPAVGQAGREAIVAPRNEVEEVVVAASEALLGVPVSVTDNFFDLGGHSLLVTQLASRLRRDLQTDVSLRLIFESPTMEDLADRLVTQLLEEEPSAPEQAGA